jgi:RNA polymerase sigma factor (sigma-70 family)
VEQSRALREKVRTDFVVERDSEGVQTDEREDDELILAVVDRDLGALRTLHERHAPWLVARLRRRCGDADLVAEALQDTFLAVWRGAHRYDGRGEVAAWIWGIAIRQLIGRTRRRPAPVPFAQEALLTAMARSGAADMLVSAEDAALLGVEHGDLHGALTQLSPDLRSVVQATVLDGLTTREAARLLGIPAGTVKTRMRRARIQLRGALS